MSFIRTCALGALASATLATAAQAVVVPAVSAVAVSRDRTTGASGPQVVGTDYPAAEGPFQAVDGSVNTKYLNFNGAGLDGAGTSVANPTGLVATFASPVAINSFRFATANDFPSRDPGSVLIEGTNSTPDASLPGSAFTQVYSGPTGIASGQDRFTFGPSINFANTTAYSSYRVIITDLVRVPGNAPTNSQFSEIEFSSNGVVPEPASLGLLGLGGLTLLRRRRA